MRKRCKADGPIPWLLYAASTPSVMMYSLTDFELQGKEASTSLKRWQDGDDDACTISALGSTTITFTWKYTYESGLSVFFSARQQIAPTNVLLT